ncbi:MAG TPA: peptidyl-prolyl cis-trans isomerase [Solirubrobacteraceae bacterium]|jgi:foldase protein PrsA|nr:peptidyl-prolyl cis-trans isomerase [Solirubrobacteraceae bacterium]
MRKLVRVSALGAFFVAAAVLLAACGGSSLPGNSVAKVGDQPVTKGQFDHWMKVAAVQLQQQNGQTGPAVVPDAPTYAKCVAAARKAAPKPKKGQPKTSDATYRNTCDSEFSQLRDSVMSFLISAYWIVGEAKDQGVSVTAKDVDKQFADLKKQSFSKESDFKSFLKSSGMTLDDLKFRVKIDALTSKLRDKIVKGKDKVTSKQIATYYKKNPGKFSAPERRDIKVVLTKTKSAAESARSALAGGASWATVAKKDSIDATKDAGGVMLNVAKGNNSLDVQLASAVFAAKPNRLIGPVKTALGYYDFTVTKVTAPSKQTLAQATPTIKQLLAGQQQQKALDSFSNAFSAKWTKKTTCRSGSPSYVVSDCHNAPKQSTTTAAAATTTAAG